MKELIIEAVNTNLDEVLAFVDEQLEEANCSSKIQTTIEIAVEELFVNIANYAYSPEIGTAVVQISVNKEPLSVEITFIDNGKPYDPLAKPDPDVTLSAEERQIGGLGIFILRRKMDDVRYVYENNRNILTIEKYI